MTKLALTPLATLFLGSSIALANPAPEHAPEVHSIDIGTRGSARGVSEGWMVLPQGLELASELRFITATGDGLGAEPLAFTDVAVLTLRARRSIGGRAEVSGSIDILPKQPSWSEERLWQGASVALRVQPTRKPVAIALRASGGPMLAELGLWGQASAGLNARKRIHDIMTFEGAATAAGSYLAPRRDGADPAWLVEAAVSGSVLFRDPYGKVGGWLGIGYAVPVAHDGRDPMSGAELDPQNRLDLQIGGVVTIVNQWDLFAQYAVIDRGDMAAMATRLPILDGGFDQRQIVIGIGYHPKPAAASAPMLQY